MQAFFGGGLQGLAGWCILGSIFLGFSGVIIAPIIGIPLGIYFYKRGKGLIKTDGDKWRD